MLKQAPSHVINFSISNVFERVLILNDHKTKKQVKAAVKDIDWILGDTHTAMALREVHAACSLKFPGLF